MVASVGSLVVSLGLDAAQYTQGLTKAEYNARKFGESIGSGIRTAAIASTAAIAGLAAAAVAASAAFDHLLEGAGKFQDLAEETGDSAAAIASFATIADGAGVSIESIAGAMNKLTKNLSSGSKESAEALKALGLSLKDLQKLGSADQFEAVANAFNEFGDSTDKVAVAMALFGKSGAEQLKVFKELQAEGGRTNILTADQIKLADDYLDKQAVLISQLKQYASAIATDFVPAVNALISVLVNAAKGFFDTKTAVDALASGGAIQQFAENAGRSLAGMVDYVTQSVKELRVLFDFVTSSAKALSQVASFDFAGAKATGKEFRDRYGLDELGRKVSAGAGQEAAKTFVQSYNETLAGAKRSQFAAIDPRRVDLAGNAKPNLKFSGGGAGGSGSDATKNILDNNLKALENAAKEEQDIRASRNKMLDLYNSANLISTQDYYNGKRVAQEQAVSAQSDLYDQEIAALQAYQAKAGKATEREATQGKINDLVEKKAKLYRDAGEAAIEMGFKEQQANDALAKQLNSVNAQVLEMTGNLGAAARIRVGDQFGDLSKRLQANGDTAGLGQVERLKQLTIAQADFGQQTQEVARITQSLQLQEDRIQISRQLGADSELSSLIKLRDARQATVAQMKSIVEAQEAIANASGNPALIQNAQQARVALEQLAAAADPLADKFNSIFTDSFGDAFADFITGTKTAKEAFNSFASSVFSQLAKMASEGIAKQLFSSFGSGDGTAGGIGALLSGLFGHAGGGFMTPNSMAQVNENGPELFDYQGKQYLLNGNKSGRVTANGKMGGGSSIVINQTFAPNATRDTTQQAALQASRELQRSQRNA